jgi:hypothetical protein
LDQVKAPVAKSQEKVPVKLVLSPFARNASLRRSYTAGRSAHQVPTAGRGNEDLR